MKHPFDGIITDNKASASAGQKEPSRNRRSFLRRIVAVITGLVGFVIGSQANQVRAVEQRVTTMALGEEGGGVTTQAIGEEGGGGRPRPPRPRPRPTTYALGEEGAGSSFPRGSRRPPRPT